MLTEKQLNNRASILPIEDIFTDADVNPSTDYDSRRGYKFEYPARWMNDPSEYKRIGIRWLDVTPTSHTFSMGIRIWKQFAHKIPCNIDDITDPLKWSAGSVNRILCTKEWRDAQSYWNKYSIPQKTSPIQVIAKPTEYDRREASREVYLDTNGKFNMALVTNNVFTVATIWEFEYDSETGEYTIDEVAYTSVNSVPESYLETARIDDFSFTSENGIEEILKLICQSFNENVFNQPMFKNDESNTPVTIDKYVMTYDYNYRTGHTLLEIHYIDEFSEYQFNAFSFYGNTKNDIDDITELFNQPKPKDGTPNKMLFMRDEEYKPEIMILNNVWNRKRIFIHSSFSETRRNIIGTSGDWYDSPSKFFHAPTNTSEFNIWFTTDGKNVILPLYCPFVIELCFLMNYKTAKLT